MDIDFINVRMYDEEIGKFLTVDPLADEYPGWSPYVYALNNPLRYNDPTGLCPEDGSAGENQFGPGYCLEEIVVTATRIPATRPFSNTIASLPALAVTTQVDGPLPFADIAAAAALTGFLIYDSYLIFNPVSPEQMILKAEGEKGIAVGRLPDLTGKTRNEAEKTLEELGFVNRGETTGGYAKHYHPDGSKVFIRPNGEVVRTGERIGRNYSGITLQHWNLVCPDGKVIGRR